MRVQISHTLWAVAAGSALASAAMAADDATSNRDLFETQILPLLAQHCQECHGEDQQESGLRLDSLAAIARGGKAGPAFVPGKPDESLLISAVGYVDESLQMPPDKKLPAEAIALLKRWVETAPPLAGELAQSGPDRASQAVLERALALWSFQPLIRPRLPEVKQRDWPVNPVDVLLLADLERQHLRPAPPASKRQLLRRATLDLIGLPPTPEETAAFLEDDSPQAFEKVIDRLLASPHYGERWGRHWLDVARYADSNGLDENVAHGNAWRYRDYVIAAFNNDKPYDRFLTEQLAGDLLPEGPETEHERLIATGFLTLGAKSLAEADKTKLQMDVVDEQIDSLGQALLGLTLGCARCHDHKFDPIRAEDYYALAGIFVSTQTMESLKTIARWNENAVASSQQLEERRLADAGVTEQKAGIQKLIDQTNQQLFSQTNTAPPKDAEQQYPKDVRDQLKQMRDELARREKALPTLPSAMGVKEATEAKDTRIHVRGSHLSLGKPVHRGLPAALLQATPVSVEQGHSGRLELAQWMTDRKNPLTARVMVNRLWRWHFGQGLVASADNFGQLGERPLNQPLLDWLAAEFMEQGWSLKRMHKLVMLSRTYQMSSQPDAACAALDPDNRHHWRANVRRMEAEALRDSLLSVSGLLDTSRGGSLLHVGNREFIFNHTSKDETRYDVPRRSVYLPIIRNNLYDEFSLFDYTDAALVTGDRANSTIAPQALFLLNSDLMLQACDGVAARVLEPADLSLRERIDRLYSLALLRRPTPSEAARLETFIESVQSAWAQRPPDEKLTPERAAWSAACQAVLSSNEFIYVE